MQPNRAIESGCKRGDHAVTWFPASRSGPNLNRLPGSTKPIALGARKCNDKKHVLFSVTNRGHFVVLSYPY